MFNDLEQKILNNELDFILIEGISHTPAFVSEEYMEDSLTVICPANSRFFCFPIWEAMSTKALINAVINGLGIAVLPHRMVIGPIERGLDVAVHVKGLSFKRKFNIVYHKKNFLLHQLNLLLICVGIMKWIIHCPNTMDCIRRRSFLSFIVVIDCWR